MENIKKYIFSQIAEHKLDIKTARELLAEMEEGKKGGTDGKIAIIGMACRFPEADDIDQFWKNLVEGRNCIGVPGNYRRAPLEKWYAAAMGKKSIHREEYDSGGYLSDIDLFDAGFFSLHDKEADNMDPWQRLFLEVAYQAVEDAGYGGSALSGTDTGVFAGRDMACASNYGKLAAEHSPLLLTGCYESILAGRISHALNLRGPSMVLDTACSSSLVALNQACMLLRDGACSMAIVGGINIKENLVSLSENLMENILTKNDKVCTFDKDASGTVLSEGVGVLVLKPYDKALKDGDMIYASILGSAINNNGRGEHITTPDSRAQEDVILKACENAGISLESIEYMEAHGTGTLLGDSMEVSAVNAAMRRFTGRKQFCALGTVKANIGHTVGASGMASIMKAVLAMQNHVIPANINFKEANPLIDFPSTAFYVNTVNRAWDSREGIPRRCAVNSFGFSGTNCHVILEEERINVDVGYGQEKKAPYFLCLSAKSVNALKLLSERYLDMVERAEEKQLNIADLCYSSCMTRGHYSCRLLIIVNNWDDLKNNLSKLLKKFNSYVEKHSGRDDAVFFHIISEEEAQKKPAGEILQWSRMDENAPTTEEIALHYISGEEVDWTAFYMGQRCHKIRLPLYPYDKKSHWLPMHFDGNFLVNSLTVPKSSEERFEDFTVKQGEALIDYVERIWKNVLKIGEVKKTDNFYQLGGDSLRAVKIADIISEHTGITFNLTDILNNPTLESLLHILEQKKDTVKELGNVELHLPERGQIGELEVSPVQKRLLILQSFDRNDISYNLSSVICMKGNFDAERCEAVLKTLVKRHEALRSFYSRKEEKLLYVVDDEMDFHVQRISLSEEENVETILRAQIKAFPMDRPPLFRVVIGQRSLDEHILLFDFHHIIADARSMEIITQEFISLYDGGQLPRVLYQFSDYLLWQSGYLKSREIAESEDFWLKHLEGELPVLNMPLTYPRPSRRSSRGAHITVMSGGELYESVLRVASEYQSSPYTVMLAAYYILLGKYTDQEDIVIGTPVQGRGRKEFADTVGMFVQTIAVRNKPQKDKLVSVFLREVKNNCMDTLLHQNYPFNWLVDKIVSTVDYSRNPIFDTMFNYLDFAEREIQLKDVVISYLNFENSTSKFDLTLEVVKHQGYYCFDFEYCTDLFEESFIQNFAANYLFLLGNMLVDLECSVKEIEFVSPEEKSLLDKWKCSESVVWGTEGLYERYEKQLTVLPNNPAVLEKGVIHSYSALGATMDEIDRILEENMITAGGIVGVYMERSFYSIAAFLAVLKRRAVYLPLDRNLPVEQVRAMLEECRPAIVVATSETGNVLAETEVPYYTIDNKKLFQGKRSTNAWKSLPDTCYVIYTSGSTRKPKGVLGTEKGLINRLEWMWKQYPYKTDEVCCHKTSLNFVDSICEILSPILQGIPIVVIPDSVMRNPVSLINILSDHSISRITLVPALLEVLLDTGIALDEKLKALKYCICSGDELRVETVMQVRNRLPSCRLLNLYGASEISADVTCFDTRDLKEHSYRVPLGKPIANTKLYILNQDKHRVPAGVWGGLFVGGDSLARGYMDDLLQTERKFLILPVDGPESQCLYDTGDIVRFCSDGSVEYSGREDYQIKIDGKRMDLESISLQVAEVLENPYVHTIYRRETGSLIAFVKGKQQVKDTELRKKMVRRMTRSSIPQIVYVSDFPVNVNGKIDNGKLMELYLEYGSFRREEEMVITATEQFLVDVWKELLDTDNIHPEDSIYDFGGNSLQAMRFSMRVNKTYGVEILMENIFEDLTLRELGQIIDKKRIKAQDKDVLERILLELEN